MVCKQEGKYFCQLHISQLLWVALYHYSCPKFQCHEWDCFSNKIKASRFRQESVFEVSFFILFLSTGIPRYYRFAESNKAGFWEILHSLAFQEIAEISTRVELFWSLARRADVFLKFIWIYTQNLLLKMMIFSYKTIKI